MLRKYRNEVGDTFICSYNNFLHKHHLHAFGVDLAGKFSLRFFLENDTTIESKIQKEILDAWDKDMYVFLHKCINHLKNKCFYPPGTILFFNKDTNVQLNMNTEADKNNLSCIKTSLLKTYPEDNWSKYFEIPANTPLFSTREEIVLLETEFSFAFERRISFLAKGKKSKLQQGFLHLNAFAPKDLLAEYFSLGKHTETLNQNPVFVFPNKQKMQKEINFNEKISTLPAMNSRNLKNTYQNYTIEEWIEENWISINPKYRHILQKKISVE